MIASRLMSRSPVWLRKIPSTVSGSQGSAGPCGGRALRVPAWRKIEYYLARSAVSRTFFQKVFRPSANRGRPGPGVALRGDEFGIIRAPGAARAGNPPAHRMPTTPAGWSRRGLLAFAKLLTERIPAVPPDPAFRGDSLPKEERPPPGPPAFRAGNPLGDRPWSILNVGGFPSFRY